MTATQYVKEVTNTTPQWMQEEVIKRLIQSGIHSARDIQVEAPMLNVAAQLLQYPIRYRVDDTPWYEVDVFVIPVEEMKKRCEWYMNDVGTDDERWDLVYY